MSALHGQKYMVDAYPAAGPEDSAQSDDAGSRTHRRCSRPPRARADRHDATDTSAGSCTRGGHNPPVTFQPNPPASRSESTRMNVTAKLPAPAHPRRVSDARRPASVRPDLPRRPPLTILSKRADCRSPADGRVPCWRRRHCREGRSAALSLNRATRLPAPRASGSPARRRPNALAYFALTAAPTPSSRFRPVPPCPLAAVSQVAGPRGHVEHLATMRVGFGE